MNVTMNGTRAHMYEAEELAPPTLVQRILPVLAEGVYVVTAATAGFCAMVIALTVLETLAAIGFPALICYVFAITAYFAVVNLWFSLSKNLKGYWAD